MVTCNDRDLWSRIWVFKDHGKSWDAVYESPHPPGFRWLHESIGTNWRMLEMHAAIGRIQLRRMAEWTRARTANATILQDALTPFAGRDGIIRLGGPLGQDASWPEGSRSEEHTSELQSLMRISYAVFCLKKKKKK